MQRVCFLLQVKKDRLEEYRKIHTQVWPEMLQALRETGWRNYSLFLREDGLLVGYCEVDDFAKSQAAIKSLPISEKWEAMMAPYFEANQRADDAKSGLEEVFHLD